MFAGKKLNCCRNHYKANQQAIRSTVNAQLSQEVLVQAVRFVNGTVWWQIRGGKPKQSSVVKKSV